MVVGDQYPAANILGMDLSPIQPEWVPPNVQFVVDDVESPCKPNFYTKKLRFLYVLLVYLD